MSWFSRKKLPKFPTKWAGNRPTGAVQKSSDSYRGFCQTTFGKTPEASMPLKYTSRASTRCVRATNMRFGKTGNP